MKEQNEEKSRIRKVYAAKGERGQKPFNFRLDLDLLEYLTRQPNKGRYLNDLIRADMEAHQGQ